MMDYSRYSDVDPARVKELVEAQPQRTETAAERAARTAYESAQAHLQKVNTAKQADGRATYSWEDRGNAERDVETKKTEMWRVQNAAAQQWRLDRDASVLKAADDQRAEERTARAKEIELRHKEVYRHSYLEAGGQDSAFEAAWPAIWADHLLRESVSRANSTREQLRVRYGGPY